MRLPQQIEDFSIPAGILGCGFGLLPAVMVWKLNFDYLVVGLIFVPGLIAALFALLVALLSKRFAARLSLLVGLMVGLGLSEIASIGWCVYN